MVVLSGELANLEVFQIIGSSLLGGEKPVGEAGERKEVLIPERTSCQIFSDLTEESSVVSGNNLTITGFCTFPMALRGKASTVFRQEGTL